MLADAGIHALFRIPVQHAHAHLQALQPAAGPDGLELSASYHADKREPARSGLGGSCCAVPSSGLHCSVSSVQIGAAARLVVPVRYHHGPEPEACEP